VIVTSGKRKIIFVDADGTTDARLKALSVATRRSKSAILRELVRVATVLGPDLRADLVVHQGEARK